MIPLHKPYLSGNELLFLEEAINDGQLSGNGKFTNRCHSFFEKQYGLKKCLLTNSCTSALEMAVLLLDIREGDEVIVPSFTFVSTANPFVIRGAKIVFADSQQESPNIDETKLEELITNKTKAIVVVHYAGIACNMDAIHKIADEHNIFVVEDAAHAQDAYFNEKALGGIGHLGAYSFHATKNITSGEGGLLIVNKEEFIERAEILWEKGTNRKNFMRGDVDKYEWCDIGSSFYPSELTAAFLWSQLQVLKQINAKRMEQWNYYVDSLQNIGGIETPVVPEYARHNAHLFYLKTQSRAKRDKLIEDLNGHGIGATFHYLALHKSSFMDKQNTQELDNAVEWEDRIIRLPLYHDLRQEEQEFIIDTIKKSTK